MRKFLLFLHHLLVLESECEVLLDELERIFWLFEVFYGFEGKCALVLVLDAVRLLHWNVASFAWNFRTSLRFAIDPNYVGAHLSHVE